MTATFGTGGDARNDVDRLLQDLRTTHATVTSNLLELEANPTYTLLVAGDGLAGKTAERARPALAAVAGLWRDLELLEDLLERAEACRRDDALRALLTGPSITLTPESVPLGERGLTAPAVTAPTITPGELLQSMERAFAAVRDVVTAVDEAWRDLLPRVDRTTAEAQRLLHDRPDHPMALAALRSLESVTATVADDPLAAAAVVERVERDVDAAVAAAQALARRSEALRIGLSDARATMAELEAAIAAGRAALDQARADVAEPEGLLAPVDRSVLDGDRGLVAWLARIDELGDDEMAAAERGLQSWWDMAHASLATARKVAESNAAPSRRRAELRGLLRAAEAKAGATGRIEDPALAELAERAAAALRRPCDLATAEQLVTAYVRATRTEAQR